MSSILENQKLSLILCGLLPLNSQQFLPNWASSLSFLPNNSMFLLCFLNFFHIIVFIGYAILFATDVPFELRTVQIQDFSAIVTVLIYLVVFLVKRKRIQEAISAVEQDLPSRSLAGVVYIEMRECVQRSRVFTKVMVLSFVAGTVFHGMTPLFRGQAYNAFPFQVLYPWTWVYKSPYYEILYTIQMVAQLHIGLLYSSFMTLFVSVARIMTVQYEMLLCSLKNITNSAYIRRGDVQSRGLLRKSLWRWRGLSKPKQEYFEGREVEEDYFDSEDSSLGREGEFVDDMDAFECGQYDEEVLEAVKECCKRHTLILRICKDVEDILSFNMLNTIGILTLAMCIIIFAMTTIGKLNESTVDFANYLVLGYFEMLIMCYYPHLMSYQSGMINAAVNETPWHLFGPRVRKHLVVLMLNAQKPFYFTCGSLFVIDLRLFLLSVKTSFSFYMLLSNIHT